MENYAINGRKIFICSGGFFAHISAPSIRDLPVEKAFSHGLNEI
jgi:hypothetical protein